MKTTARKNSAAAKVAVTTKPENHTTKQTSLKVVKDEQPNPTAPAAQKQGASKLNLQETLKIVDQLHRKVIQRTNLINLIDTLQAFTVKQVEDEHGQPYTTCEITITDDQRNTWKTKNTFLIAELVKYALSICIKRLSEIEGGINIPETKIQA